MFKRRSVEDKAKDILRDSNWFRDYYYVVKVIESCEGTDKPMPIMNARKWGFKLLDDKYENIQNKLSPELKKATEELYFDYRMQLRDIFEGVWDKVAKKIVANANDGNN